MPNDNNLSNSTSIPSVSDTVNSPPQAPVEPPTDTQPEVKDTLSPPLSDPTPAQDSTTSPSSDSDQPTVNAPHAPKKYGGKKIIATIFGILFLIGGVAAGVYLVQRQQELAERAASGKECSQSPDCILLDEPGNEGTFTAPRRIDHVLVTARDVFRFDPPGKNDGCYDVTIDGNSLRWRRVGSGSECKDVSNVQVWLGGEVTPTQPPINTPIPTPTLPPGVTPTSPPPAITAQCLGVKAYDKNWNLLSKDDLSKMKKGDIIRFATTGSASSGTFDKARFTINGTLRSEVTAKKPGSDEFYDQYTIPDGVTTFNVKGEVHHSSLGWF